MVAANASAAKSLSSFVIDASPGRCSGSKHIAQSIQSTSRHATRQSDRLFGIAFIEAADKIQASKGLAPAVVSEKSSMSLSKMK